MTELASKHCRARSGEASRLSDEEADRLLKQLPGWQRSDGAITKTFAFQNYHETLAFVNASAWIAHREDHHPELQVGFNRCQVRYSTHSVKGLSENDFICAARVEQLLTD